MVWSGSCGAVGERSRYRMFTSRFWLGYILTVFLTGTMPLIVITEGSQARRVTILHLYPHFAAAPSGATIAAPLAHLVACFALCLVVRMRILRAINQEPRD